MKTVKFTAIIALLFILNSCTQESNDHALRPYSEIFTVLAKDWVHKGTVDEIGSYYEFIFDKLPLKDAYDNGIITAYMYLNYDTPKETLTPLPLTTYEYEDEYGYYETYYTYDVAKDGTVAFKAYVSDYYTGSFNPGTKSFRIAITW